MHYFKRNIGDYHKKAGRLSMLEHGAYTLLLDACYDRERFPTLDEALEWSWARTDEEVSAVKFVLSKFFSLVDGKYAQQRVQDEIDAYHAKSLKNQEIALAREAARRELRARNVHETCTDHHLTTNQEPLTTNQEPEEIKNISDQQAESQKPEKAKRATKIPDPFFLTQGMRSWAAEKADAVNIREETENFVDYWRGAGKAKADWIATWRTWMRKAQKDAERGKRYGQPVNRQQQVEDSNARVVQEIIARESGFSLGEPIPIDGEVIHVQ